MSVDPRQRPGPRPPTPVLIRTDPGRAGGFPKQWFRLGNGFVANVNLLTRPNLFVNVDDRDVFFPLVRLGLLDAARDRGLVVETPHGAGHNCFKISSDQLPPFLDLLAEFFVRHADAIRLAAATDPRVTNWRESWWYEVGGIAPNA